MQHSITTTIEKQELHELPEQIEYVNPNQPMLRSNHNENEMEQQQQQMMMMMQQMPETKYLPPPPPFGQATQQLQLKDLMPAMPAADYLPPTVKETMPQQIQLDMPAMKYLPPPSVPMQVMEQQPNYQLQQQYQEEPSHEQHMEMLEAMRIAMAAVEQPQMTQAIMEPEPAHILAADGYHYKNDGGRRRFRFSY